FGPVVGSTYGQTESPQIVTAITPAELDDPANQGSVGCATWFWEFAIMDRQGRLSPAGQPGEMVVRVVLVMACYCRQRDKSAETIVGGWLHTGDVGAVDERGYLFIKDPLRVVIVTGGFSV